MASGAMRKSPKEKKLIPKDLAKRSDHEIMEIVLGKRVMRVVDAVLAEHNREPDEAGPNKSP